MNDGYYKIKVRGAPHLVSHLLSISSVSWFCAVTNALVSSLSGSSSHLRGGGQMMGPDIHVEIQVLCSADAFANTCEVLISMLLGRQAHQQHPLSSQILKLLQPHHEVKPKEQQTVKH